MIKRWKFKRWLRRNEWDTTAVPAPFTAPEDGWYLIASTNSIDGTWTSRWEQLKKGDEVKP